MQEKKKHPVIIFLLWITFIITVAGVAYLSFQSGAETKLFGQQLIETVADIQYPDGAATRQEMDTLIYEVRQAGRVFAFFFIGILGTVTIHVSCRKCNWIVKTSITAMVLVAIAYFTEKLKIYIPSRHYDYEEMLISILAVVVGFILVSIITLTFHALKGFFRLIAAVH